MLSPLEVKKREFTKTIRGFDVTEVRSFLEEVAAELEHLTDTQRIQLKELENLRAEISTFQRMEQNLKDALMNAQDALRKTRENSQKEADLLKKEAKMEAENIFREAYRHAEDLRQEMNNLSARRDRFVSRWKAILKSELEMLELIREIEDEQYDPFDEPVNPGTGSNMDHTERKDDLE